MADDEKTQDEQLQEILSKCAMLATLGHRPYDLPNLTYLLGSRIWHCTWEAVEGVDLLDSTFVGCGKTQLEAANDLLEILTLINQNLPPEILNAWGNVKEWRNETWIYGDSVMSKREEEKAKEEGEQ